MRQPGVSKAGSDTLLGRHTWYSLYGGLDNKQDPRLISGEEVYKASAGVI